MYYRKIYINKYINHYIPSYSEIGLLIAIPIDQARREIEQVSVYPQVKWFFQVFDKYANPIKGFQRIVREKQRDEENFSFCVDKLKAYYVMGMNKSDPYMLLTLQSAILDADFERMNMFHTMSSDSYPSSKVSLELTLAHYNDDIKQQLNYGAVLYAKNRVTLETKDKLINGFKTYYEVGLNVYDSKIEPLASHVYNDIQLLRARDEHRKAAKKRLCEYKVRKIAECFSEGLASIFR